MFFKYTVSDKKFLEIRNRIFVDNGVPTLVKNGFEKSPFSASWFGRNNLGDFSYQMCRLGQCSDLELITTHISKGDSWIKIYLNIFTLDPTPKSLGNLKGLGGLQYLVPPNSITNMRLRSDDIKDFIFFRVLFGKNHKMGSYYTENGLNRRIKHLGNLVEKDMNNIDYFVKRWYEIHHNPIMTTWEGTPL